MGRKNAADEDGVAIVDRENVERMEILQREARLKREVSPVEIRPVEIRPVAINLAKDRRAEVGPPAATDIWSLERVIL